MKQTEKSMITKNRVLNAAEKLFLEKGYEPTTMQDIIIESGMSRGAIYHQYESKQEILKALTVRAQERVRSHFENLNNEFNLSAKEKIMLMANYFDDDNPHKYLIKSDWVEKIPYSLLETLRFSVREFAPILSDIILQGVEKKEFECNAPTLTAEFILIFIDIWIDPVIFSWTKDEANARFGYLAAVLNQMAPGMMTIEEIEKIKPLILANSDSFWEE